MTSPRITVPTLFDGDWDSVIICTYGADLAFYERDLWRQVQRARNRLIFADGRQVTRQLIDPEGRAHLRQVNRTYVLAPMRTEHAAHAKLILLLREDRGLLSVGSGNLGMDGYASQGECFTTYRWAEDQPEHLNAFVAAKAFLSAIVNRGLVDTFVRPLVQQAWQDAPWIYRTANGDSRALRHNLDRPLLDQFIEAIGEHPVDELVVHAPFYDHRCRALAELIMRTKPRKLQLLLQERITSVDPERLAKVLASAGCPVDVRSVQAQEPGTFLHAKFVIARCNDVDLCLQGSPNLSTPALLKPFPTGNIELANLLVGGRGKFDHLVADLAASPTTVEIADLGLSLAKDDDATEAAALDRCVRELVWAPPHLAGEFDRAVSDPPVLLIGEDTVNDVLWALQQPVDDATSFTVTLGEHATGLMERVEAIRFIFDASEPTAPVYPYHRNTLIALASGQGRTDLLKQAGDFDLGDEELEPLLAQLDEVLVVDGHSLWRMLKRKAPEPEAEEGTSAISYDDLDWEAIQSHPKLAQYRTWNQHGKPDPSGLGILLSSIAERFRTDVERRRSGRAATDEPPTDADPFDDFAAAIEAEDEQTAGAQELASEKRRMSARARAKRQYHNFVKRFVNGITDEEFVRLVGPSVMVPSYVVFNHLCWKLIQVDLADPDLIVHAEVALWRFFWGEPGRPGYFAAMNTEEQEATLDILDRHHAEAVLLCSLFQAWPTTPEGTDDDVAGIRDAWRCILDHPLWQPTKTAVLDAATTLEPMCGSAGALVDKLDGLASFMTKQEPLHAIETILAARPRSVSTAKVLVRRAELGDQRVTAFVIQDPAADLTRQAAARLIRELRSMLPKSESDYIRIEHPSAKVVAFADYITEDYLYADKDSGQFQTLTRPAPIDSSWRHGLDELHMLAG